MKKIISKIGLGFLSTLIVFSMFSPVYGFQMSNNESDFSRGNQSHFMEKGNGTFYFANELPSSDPTIFLRGNLEGFTLSSEFEAIIQFKIRYGNSNISFTIELYRNYINSLKNESEYFPNDEGWVQIGYDLAEAQNFDFSLNLSKLILDNLANHSISKIEKEFDLAGVKVPKEVPEGMVIPAGYEHFFSYGAGKYYILSIFVTQGNITYTNFTLTFTLSKEASGTEVVILVLVISGGSVGVIGAFRRKIRGGRFK